MILKDGTEVQDPRLGRLVSFDEHSRSYPIMEKVEGQKERSYSWRCDKVLDQGLDGACHVEGTEILTSNGWFDFRHITEDDLLATVNQDTHILEFQQPTKLIQYEYEGNLIQGDNSHLKFAVTPNHRMYVRKWNQKNRKLEDSYDFVNADELGWYSGVMGSPAMNTNTTPLNNISFGKFDIEGDDFLSFLGIFLAEGCLYYHKYYHKKSGSYRIEIAAVKPHCREEVYNIVSALGMKISIYHDRYVIYNKDLFVYLKDMYANGALSKSIPRWIVETGETQINRFLDAFCLGDGHITKDGSRRFYTSSPYLADGIQELFLRIGVRSNVVSREPRDAFIEGRHIPKENISVSYIVAPWKKTTLSIDRKKQISSVAYKGKVYCATVPNSTLVTRYKGTVLVSGNCVGFGIAHELIARPAEAEGIDAKFAKEKIYWEAQKIDPWDGGAYPGAKPKYEGTSVLSGVKIAQALGWFDEYRWAFSLKAVILGVGHNGPAVIGVNWFDGMFTPDSKGFITPAGDIRGGHCVIVRAVNVKEKYFTIRNSWGASWGHGGDCYMTFDDFDTLIHSWGEVVFFIKRHRDVH